MEHRLAVLKMLPEDIQALTSHVPFVARQFFHRNCSRVFRESEMPMRELEWEALSEVVSLAVGQFLGQWPGVESRIPVSILVFAHMFSKCLL
jgi:hypothetical protein